MRAQSGCIYCSSYKNINRGVQWDTCKLIDAFCIICSEEAVEDKIQLLHGTCTPHLKTSNNILN